jgi:sugar phosphate isomerase/epimerase
MDRPGAARPATTEIRSRLGVNVHRDEWPTTSRLKAVEAAGFSWVQVHTPPVAMLADRERMRRHARALRAALDPSGLRLLLHGPDDLTLGGPEANRAGDGLLDYAQETRAEIVVYHGLNLVDVDGPAADVLRARVEAEEDALERLGRRAHAAGVTIAVENLAPVYPSPPIAARLCHDPLRVHDLVRRLDLASVGMLLDLGHAHITCGRDGTDLETITRRVADAVVLFHVHDNLGARRHDVGFPGVDPLRLDLHLPPGEGTLPWDRVREIVRAHRAPLMLEVEPSHRPELVRLQRTTSELLVRERARATAAAA